MNYRKAVKWSITYKNMPDNIIKLVIESDEFKFWESFEITKNMSINFQIFDMGGLKSFKKVRKHYYQDAKVVIILFDYSRLKTLENINEWIEEANNFIKNPEAIYYLVGNKIDLINDRESIQSSAIDLSNNYNFSYYETSAYTGEGVDELFTSCISNLL